MLCDAAESFGATYAGRAAGSFGDASVLSFNGNKIMTTSGGGMLLTDDEALAQHVRKLSTQAREPVPHYEHTEIGYNYRLSNILAALGRGQLARLDEMLARRRAVARALPGRVRRLAGRAHPRGSRRRRGQLLAHGHRRRPQRVVAGPSPTSGPPWRPAGSRPARCGSRCTCSPSQPGSTARSTGPPSGSSREGLTLPSGSAMTEAQFEVVESVVADVVGR